MSSELKLTYTSGLTGITANVFSADGDTARGADIAMSDTGHLGLYLGDLTTIELGDIVIFYVGGVYLTSITYETIDWVTVSTEESEVLNITICNQALGLLGAAEISADDSSTLNYGFCETIYADARNEILAAHPWNFACKRAFAIQTTDPLFGYDNAFTMPSDCLRILTIAQDPAAKFRREGDLILTDEGETPPDYDEDGVDYLAGQYISSDFSDSDLTYLVDTAFTSDDEETDLGTYCTSQEADLQYLEVEYIYKATDVSSYPAALRQCVVINLARMLCSPIKQSEDVAFNLQAMLYGSRKVTGYLDIARSLDAQESGGTVIKTQTWLDSRK